MTPSQQGPGKIRRGLFAGAILLLLAAGTAFSMGGKDFTIQSLGLVALIASVCLVRASNVHSTRSAVVITSSQGRDSNAKSSGGRLIWIIGTAMLPIAVASYFYLRQDALHGYHEVLPVYVFAGVAVLCAGVWSYLVSRVLH
jgi:cytochrome bd-type quinol oxidase subunit 2